MRIYQAVLLAVTGIVIAAIAAFILYGGGTGGKGVASIGGPFSLTDHKGQPKTDRDFRGRYMLIYFGFTYCPDVCPTALQSMTLALGQLAPETQDKITPVFITIDPERDTAEQLKTYVENFHPRMVGLTGTPEQIAQTARVYRVYFARAKDEKKEATDYLMDHSSIVFLMNPEGEYVTHFTHATSPEKMAERLATVVGR
jgi:cytochrome oxidase Cu insertion factor (SCO1/SenC/PrrC family)